MKTQKNKGFTLIELIVAIAIIATLSAVVLFSITYYLNKGKDASVQGNLAILVTAGEVYYNSHGSYDGFCQSSVVANAQSQIPRRTGSMACYPLGICCKATADTWAACARELRAPLRLRLSVLTAWEINLK